MRKSKSNENYLDKIPVVNPKHRYTVDAEGIVTIEIENIGLMNALAQKLFKKPKISYVHLDSFGSFVWQQIDGKSDITRIGVAVDAHFGEDAQPLYERLAMFFKTLSSYGFVIL